MIFYVSVDIGIAKENLVGGNLPSLIRRWVRPAKRRDGSIEQREARVKKEIGDIFQMFSVIHEQKLVDKLPVFACADIRKLPTGRFKSGDFRAMIQRIERLENMLERIKPKSVRFVQPGEGSERICHLSCEKLLWMMWLEKMSRCIRIHYACHLLVTLGLI